MACAAAVGTVCAGCVAFAGTADSVIGRNFWWAFFGLRMDFPMGAWNTRLFYLHSLSQQQQRPQIFCEVALAHLEIL